MRLLPRALALVAACAALTPAARAEGTESTGDTPAVRAGEDGGSMAERRSDDAGAVSGVRAVAVPSVTLDSSPPASAEHPAVRPACADTAAVCVANDDFAFWPRVRVRTGYEFVTPDAELLTVGRNDGFFADQLRVGLDGAFRDRVRFRFILDATALLPEAASPLVTPTIAAARDAWVAWSTSPWLVLSAGQQFMPADIEGSTTIVMLPFARRSVATSGVRASHGHAVAGLSPTRQLGVVVGTGGPWGGPNPRLGALSLEYKLAVSNGNGQNLLGNDNKLPALYARAGAGLEDLVQLGVGGRINPRTVGSPPNLYTETDALGFVDLTVRAAGLELVAQGIARATSLDTQFPDGGAGAGQETGLGGTAWLWVKQPFGIDLVGVQPAYRISFFDASSAFVTDQLLEHSVGVRWDVPLEPLRLSVFADYTVLTELGEGVRDLANDRFTALLQLEL